MTLDEIWAEAKQLKTAELAALKSLANREIYKRFDAIPKATQAFETDEGRDVESEPE